MGDFQIPWDLINQVISNPSSPPPISMQSLIEAAMGIGGSAGGESVKPGPDDGVAPDPFEGFSPEQNQQMQDDWAAKFGDQSGKSFPEQGRLSVLEGADVSYSVPAARYRLQPAILGQPHRDTD